MNFLPPLLTIGMLSFGAVPLPAADLSKIDRTIAKEPTYHSKPKYCLLVFGPEAKTRVWLVLDGDVLYVDRNGNGNLTEDGESLKIPPFEKNEHPPLGTEWRQVTAGAIRDGALRHTNLVVRQMRWDRPVAGCEVHGYQRLDIGKLTSALFRQATDGIGYLIAVQVQLPSGPNSKTYATKHVSEFAFADGQGALQFADRPRDAPVVHFGGPLAMYPYPDQQLIFPDGVLTANIGTPGLGKGTFAFMNYDSVPPDTQPVIRVEFVAKKGNQPITTEAHLTQRC